jgi:hypothetical protein
MAIGVAVGCMASLWIPIVLTIIFYWYYRGINKEAYVPPGVGILLVFGAIALIVMWAVAILVRIDMELVTWVFEGIKYIFLR